MTRFDRVIQIANLIIQMTLLGAVLFYSVETWRLRKQTEIQVGILQRQDRTSGTPSLVIGLTHFDPQERKLWIEADEDLTPEERQAAIEQLSKKTVKYSAGVTNYSPRVAQNLEAIVYDAATRSFLLCDVGREIVSEKSWVVFDFSPPYKSPKEVAEWIEYHYGHGADYIKQFITAEDVSYVGVVFHDSQGKPYYLRRNFQKDTSKPTSYFSSVLYSPP